VQGYLFSRPLSVTDATELLRTWPEVGGTLGGELPAASGPARQNALATMGET
jgi:hypothetical protein